ncbi:MAG: hypothetical protein AAGJ82_16265 [Bacteroidota bacterium]
MNEDKQKVEELLAARFRALLPDEAAPDELQKEVFRTLDFLEMFGEIADLYTTKFGEAEMTFLDLLASDEEEGDSVSTTK